MRRLPHRLALVALVALFARCGGTDEPGPTDEGGWQPSSPRGAAPWRFDTLLAPTELRDPDPMSRRSRDNVSRPVWRQAPLSVKLRPGPGAHLDIAVARVPDADELSSSSSAAPSRLGIRVTAAGEETEIDGVMLPREGQGARPWYSARVSLANAPTGDARIHVLVDGEVVGPGGEWLLSTPRLYQERDDRHDRFNVLIITVDTLRADYLGCHGFPHGTSPNIDAFADTAVRFRRCISQASWTLPSYSSMLTGLYAESHLVVHRDQRLSGGFETFPELFAADGYTTGAVVSGTFTDNLWGFDQGFHSYDDLGMVTDDNKRGSGDPTHPDQMVSSEKRITSEEVTDKTLRWLDEHDEQRFLFVAHYFDPHSDFVAHEGITEHIPNRGEQPKRLALNNLPPDPKKLSPSECRRLYEGEVRYTDQHIGRLLDGLRARGLDGNTIVVFCADHGEEFFERAKIGHGHSIFNELVHVPLMIRVPDAAYANGGVCGDPVSNVDIGVTLLELAAIPYTPLQPGGVSLAHLLKDPGGERGGPVYSVRYPTVRSKAFEEAMPDARNMPPDWWRIDDGDLNLVFTSRRGKPLPFLFDWAKDPFQTKNVAQERTAEGNPLYQQRVQANEALSALATTVSSNMALDQGTAKMLELLGYKEEEDRTEVEEGAEDEAKDG